METEIKPNDTTYLSLGGNSADFSKWPFQGTKDFSWPSKASPIDSKDTDEDTCVSCQLCNQSVKSSKLLMHMAAHFLQLSQNFPLDDLHSTVGKHPSRPQCALDLLKENATDTDRLSELRETIKDVLACRVSGSHLRDPDTFLALAIELLAHNPNEYGSVYERIQKEWFHLDRLHYQQLTTQYFCTSCTPAVQFALESSRTLHFQLTHSNSNGMSSKQIVQILEELIAKICPSEGPDSANPFADTFDSTGPLDWTSNSKSTGGKFPLDQSLPSGQNPAVDTSSLSGPVTTNLSHSVTSLTPADSLLTGLIHPSSAFPSDGFNNMLAVLSGLPQNVTPFGAENWNNTMPGLKKPNGLPDFINPLLLTGLMTHQSPQMPLTPISGPTPTNGHNNCHGVSNSSTQQRRSRTRLSEAQLAVLRSYFDINNSPSEEKMTEICVKTGLPGKVVKHWFRNTLFKERQRTKDNPYNFSVPPSTSIDLEEYEKTGRIEVRPAPVCSERMTEAHQRSTPDGSQTPPESEKGRELQNTGGSRSGSQSEAQKRLMDNRSPHQCSTEHSGPNPPKRSRSSSVGSFGMDTESMKRGSQISSPISASNPPSVPTESPSRPSLSNSTHSVSESSEHHGHSFDFGQWLMQSSSGDFAKIPPDSRQNEGKIHPNLFHGANRLALTPENRAAVSVTNDSSTSYLNGPTTSPNLGSIAGAPCNQTLIDTFQLQKQVEAFMMAAALSQKINTSSPHVPSSQAPVLEAFPTVVDPSLDAPLDLSTSSSYATKMPSPPAPLFHMDLPFNPLDPHLSTMSIHTNSDPGLQPYVNLLHSLPSHTLTNGPGTVSHSTAASSTPGARRNRTSITALQSRCMQAIYAHHKTPSVHECDRLGAIIGLTRRVVQVWFQNQRAKEKKMARVASSYSPGNMNGGSPYPNTPSANGSGLLDFPLDPTYCGLCDTQIRCDLMAGSLPAFARSSSGNGPSSLDLTPTQTATDMHSPLMSTHSPNGSVSTGANTLASHASFVDHLFSSAHLKKLIGVCSVEVQTGQV